MFQALLPHLLTTMEYVRTFLESSSIAGFNHISTSRKGWRLFWIIVVTFGFFISGFLIHESFKSWQESPIKTTLETLPISEMMFPKVTVCPPKDTYTDLNYDVIVADNLTKNIDSYDLYLYAADVVKDHTFLDKFNNLKESNGFYNWYHGYTQRGFSKRNSRETRYSLSTFATSGSISTPYFGEKFNPSLVEKVITLQMTLFPPKAALDNPNIKLHLKIEKNILRGISRTSYDSFSVEGLYLMGEDDTVELTFNFTKSNSNLLNNHVILTLNRKITSDDLAVNNLDSMPGFNLSWTYTGAEVKPDDHNYFMNGNKTLLFRRYTKRLLNSNTDFQFI